MIAGRAPGPTAFSRLRPFGLWSTLGELSQIGFVMKNIQLIPLQPAIRLSLFIGFPTVFGVLMRAPIGWDDPNSLDINIATVLSPFLALLAWSVFHLIEPVRHGRKWEIAEFIFVPIGALLLFLSFYILCHQIYTSNFQNMEDLRSLG
jgi:hypothetical protein